MFNTLSGYIIVRKKIFIICCVMEFKLNFYIYKKNIILH